MLVLDPCPAAPFKRIKESNKKQSHPTLLVVAAAARNMNLMERGFRWFIVGKPPSAFTFAS